MLILDETYTGALFRQGAMDGFVKHSVKGGNLYKDPATARILNRGLSPSVRQDVLWDLLLFYPAICRPVDNVDFRLLLNEGLLVEELSLEKQSEYSRSFDESPGSAFLFERFIVGDVKKEMNVTVTQSDIENFVALSIKKDLGKLYSEGNNYWGYASYEDLESFYRTGLSGAELSLPGASDSTLSGSAFADMLLAELTRQKFEYFKENEVMLKKVKAIRDSASKWFLITGLANEYGAVLKVKTPSIGPSKRQFQPWETTSATNSVIKIWLDEIEVLPKLTTIEDVLRLRENKSIANFKESIMEWADALSHAGLREEEKLRAYIKKANKELKKIEIVQRVSGWSTVISLPIDIAITMSGLPIITSPIGLGLYTYEKWKAHKYDWIMFGR